jgi:flavodoxin
MEYSGSRESTIYYRKEKGEMYKMAELIAFFSRRDENYVNGMLKMLDTGNTEMVAGIIKELTGANLFQIEPLQAYSRNYNECIEQAQADQKRNARPELKDYLESLDLYKVIYLGFPNYWGTMPMAVFTFLEHFDFTGKIIRPFCTHEGSGMGSSVNDIRRLCPDARMETGLAIYGGSVQKSEKDIEKWLKNGG